ncbi:ATP-binding protein [Reichenbachiella agariperforans]|uniref:ATP-binding protein n=1 Tax=Reichenbachiella agariperforans TaxID=156994 RepID=UPI001C08E252|nr:ATP-binding protein [Reichenbachiella agariperforans]MBU2916169.1 transporter substrate-binding domain-containing protein [Reichenbachiella agariperforans]
MKRTFFLRFWLIVVLFSFLASTQASDLTWQQAQQNKGGVITIQYKLNEPFLLSNDGVLEGLEYEMMIGFQRFLSKKYGVKIQYKWHEWQTLAEIFGQIQNEENAGDIGLDIISWTADRERNVKFSNPYFPDFQVLVTHRTNPTVLHEEDFSNPYSDYTAISVLGTTYDQNLKRIKEANQFGFELKYIDKSTQIIQEVAATPRSFGYSDLTRYLLALDQNWPIKRLNAFAMKGHGLGVVFNHNSDWDGPFNEYLASPEFARIKKGSVQRYFGSEFNAFIKNLSNHQDEEVVLLMQEKMFMDEELELNRQEVERQTRVKNLMLVIIAFAVVIAFFLFNRSWIKSKANKQLLEHQEMIEKQNEELIAVNQDKNSFIHILSHDLRAPINNINSISKILSADLKLEEGETKMLHHITTESQRLSDMVTRILDIEKIESRTIDEYQPVDLGKLLAEIAKNFSSAAAAKSISIETDLEEGTYIMGLDEFVFHVFDNLLSNAIKFSPLKKSIYISTNRVGEDIEISIRDEGPGISEADQVKMFHKFQVLTAKATGGEQSNGLGLSIVSKYIGLLEGNLRCESTLGEGTAFIVSFQAAPQDVKKL